MRSHGGKSGQGSSYILGVEKLTMSCGFGGFCGFGEAFVKPKHPEGRLGGGAGGGGPVRGPETHEGCRPLFPQCQRHRCVNNNGYVQSMTDCIIIILCVAVAQM